MLQWDEIDLIECLEVLPEVYEDTIYYCFTYCFTVCKDGLRLVLTLESVRGDVQFLLYRDEIEQPIFSSNLFNCPRVRYVKNPKALDAYYQEYLEFDTSSRRADLFEPGVLDRGVRLSVKPHIYLRLFSNP